MSWLPSSSSSFSFPFSSSSPLSPYPSPPSRLISIFQSEIRRESCIAPPFSVLPFFLLCCSPLLFTLSPSPSVLDLISCAACCQWTESDPAPMVILDLTPGSWQRGQMRESQVVHFGLFWHCSPGVLKCPPGGAVYPRGVCFVCSAAQLDLVAAPVLTKNILLQVTSSERVIFRTWALTEPKN